MNNRKVIGSRQIDQGSIDNFTYDGLAGARKSTEVGRKLLPIPSNTGSPVGSGVTVINGAPVSLPSLGRNVAVYNNSGTMGSITFGSNNTVASLAAGVLDANGNVGLPCPPNSWSYFAAGEQQWVISSAATLLVFLIADDTYIGLSAGVLTSNGFST
jgi:hypothetical protein